MGCVRGGLNGRVAERDDEINLAPDEVSGERREPIELPLPVPHVQYEIAAFDVTEFPQLADKGGLPFVSCTKMVKPADVPDLLRWLPLGGERRGEEAARNPGDEGSSGYHSMI